MDNEKELVQANATRWNSKTKMVRSVLECPAEKLVEAVEKGPILSAFDRQILSDFLEVLEPFEEATDLTQGDKVVTASFIIPCIKSLRQHLATHSSNYNKKLTASLKQSLERRLSPFEENETLKLATALDPRFRYVKICIKYGFFVCSIVLQMTKLSTC